MGWRLFDPPHAPKLACAESRDQGRSFAGRLQTFHPRRRVHLACGRSGGAAIPPTGAAMQRPPGASSATRSRHCGSATAGTGSTRTRPNANRRDADFPAKRVETLETLETTTATRCHAWPFLSPPRWCQLVTGGGTARRRTAADASGLFTGKPSAPSAARRVHSPRPPTGPHRQPPAGGFSPRRCLPGSKT